MSDKRNNESQDRLSVAIVGPLSPFRGGIAQYNEQLASSISDECNVVRISFKRLYPAFLYPGESDKEPNKTEKRAIKAEQIIDAYWPRSLQKAAHTVVQKNANVALITWWTLFWQPGLAYVARKLQKQGIKVVYICHNVFDHDANTLTKLISKRFLASADGYIVHSVDEQNKLKVLYPNAKILNTRTLPVSQEFPRPNGSLSKRGKLELLFFGFIRPYKGLDTLLRAMSRLPKNHDIHLTVVGEVWANKEQLKQNIERLADKGVEAHLKYVTNQEAAEYFNRADVVVLPYKSATGSAVASQAYFYGKPILGTSVSGINDVVEEGKTGWLVQPNSAEQLAEAIKQIDRKMAAKTHPYIAKFNESHSWESIAKTYVDFARSL